ncbi:MAG: flavin reductase family protein [Pseudonocardiaceae bacterium]
MSTSHLDHLERDPTQWFPMPAALVVSCDSAGVPNLMGIGYVGFTCWQPPTIYLGINTARHSGAAIRETKQFVVGLPEPERVLNLDHCGTISGVDVDKFVAAGFTTRPADVVTPPLINECAVNLECELTKVVEIGSHDLHLGTVVRVHVKDAYISGEKHLEPIILVSRRYTAASHFLADFGASYGGLSVTSQPE